MPFAGSLILSLPQIPHPREDQRVPGQGRRSRSSLQSVEVREIKTEGKESAVWTGKGHLVLNFPRQGY